MKKLAAKYTILSLFLVAFVGETLGQKTDWEEENLQGKVKKYELFSYEFNISDSINHDEFMDKFYQCGFDADRMIRFADSINSKIVKDREFYWLREYDSVGNYTRSGDNIYYNEYDNQGHLLKMIIDYGNSPNDTIFYSCKFDEAGRLVEEKRQNRSEHWTYDSEGRLLERKVFEGEDMIEHYTLKYDKKGVLRKSEGRGGILRRDAKSYCEYDSKGNVVFERRENTGLEDIIERRIKYKYDRNDSIIKEKCRATQWRHTDIRSEGDRWQETDSTGQVVDYVNYKITRINDKKKWKEERIVTRNAEGFPIKERYVQKNSFGKTVSLSDYDNFGRITKYEEFHNDDPVPCVVIKYKYDELGREVEKERIDHRFSQFRKEVWRYHKDTNYYSYYATYDGANFGFSHESLFFFDDHDNCIAHIQWMPTPEGSGYCFNVFKFEYYE